MRRGDVVARGNCAPKSHLKKALDLQMLERSIPGCLWEIEKRWSTAVAVYRFYTADLK